MAEQVGTAVRAARDGTVVAINRDPGTAGGLSIELAHERGDIYRAVDTVGAQSL